MTATKVIYHLSTFDQKYLRVKLDFFPFRWGFDQSFQFRFSCQRYRFAQISFLFTFKAEHLLLNVLSGKKGQEPL